MKTAKKALLLTVCALVLVAATIMGTMAYLTSNDEVVNTFSVGRLAITLDEADTDEQGFGELLYKQADDTLGTTQTDTIADRVKTNAYKLMPGHHYVKDPIVHLAANSEACYVYVHIENQLVSAIEDGFYAPAGTTGEAYMPALGIKEQMTDAGWVLMHDTAKNGQSYMVWMKEVDAETAKAGTDLATFKYFDVNGAKTQTQLEAFEGKTITVTAYACQQDGFANAKAAWDACFAK